MRRDTALNQTFLSILLKHRELSSHLPSYDSEIARADVITFIQYCLEQSSKISNLAERARVNKIISYWAPVAYPNELEPDLTLAQPIAGYTFRGEADRVSPWDSPVDREYYRRIDEYEAELAKGLNVTLKIMRKAIFRSNECVVTFRPIAESTAEVVQHVLVYAHDQMKNNEYWQGSDYARVPKPDTAAYERQLCRN